MTEFTNLYEALGAVQGAIVQPKKDASNPMFKSSYVALEGVVSAINEAVKVAEAKIFWTNEIRDGVMYTIVYGYDNRLELAGSKVADNLGNRGTNSAQAEGSAITYARRYSLSMAFGISSDVDDDGNEATKQANNRQVNYHQNSKQQNFRNRQQASNQQARTVHEQQSKPIANEQNSQKKIEFELKVKKLADKQGQSYDEMRKRLLDIATKNEKYKKADDAGKRQFLMDMIERQLNPQIAEA